MQDITLTPSAYGLIRKNGAIRSELEEPLGLFSRAFFRLSADSMGKYEVMGRSLPSPEDARRDLNRKSGFRLPHLIRNEICRKKQTHQVPLPYTQDGLAALEDQRPKPRHNHRAGLPNICPWQRFLCYFPMRRLAFGKSDRSVCGRKSDAT
jgi:hypothetical protein